MHVEEFIPPELILFQPVVSTQYLRRQVALIKHPGNSLGLGASLRTVISPPGYQTLKNLLSTFSQEVRWIFIC